MKNGCLTILVVIVGGILLYMLQFETVSWKQKLTVEVETPSGMVMASSVTKVVLQEKGGFLAPIEARGLSSSLMGEAVVVDLGAGKYIFSLLKGQKSIARLTFLKESGQLRGQFTKYT